MVPSIKYLHISSPPGYLQLDFPAAAMLPRKHCSPMLQMGWVLLIWSQTRLLCSARSFFFYFFSCLEHRLGANCPDFVPSWQALSQHSGYPSHQCLVPTQSSGDLCQGEQSFEGSICQHRHFLPVKNTSHGTVVGTEKGELVHLPLFWRSPKMHVCEWQDFVL